MQSSWLEVFIIVRLEAHILHSLKYIAMDGYNTCKQHVIVGSSALTLVVIFGLLLETPWPASFARVSFLLLFLTLFIGPFMRMKKPGRASSPLATPWTWRGELGIWFALTGLMHFVLLVLDRPFSSFIEIGGGGYGLANLLGLIALFWALILAATSCSKAIKYLGMESWKWIQSLSYVIFYLVTGHYVYFQFFSTYGDNPGPDWFGYTAVIMAISIVLMQLSAFVLAVVKYRRG
ncbi:hypothetical protein HOD30_00690 [Candidatus Peregrinibacteria bacterium]|nr:hypothetical protein [Candidatus Peregrinibacteria bacterium]MBT4631943.1 hypothetical protein [Candidatus Peregrinibacteria bacterium]MBT5823670.1 hypothetical protein [Candidatus Peregrinibacteria bacterium]